MLPACNSSTALWSKRRIVTIFLYISSSCCGSRAIVASCSLPTPLRDEPVQLPSVLTNDLAPHLLVQLPQVLLDHLERVRPDTVGVRIVGAPEDVVLPHQMDDIGHDTLVLEGGVALAPPVVAGLHGEPEVGEL